MAKTFEVVYQAAASQTGLSVQCDVFKPDHTIDTVQSGVMTEVGTTGRYYKNFDADAENWHVQVSDPNGGKAVKVYDKAAYDSAGVSSLVANVQTAVDGVASAITTLQTLAGTTDGKVDIIDGNVDALVSGVTSLASDLGVISTKIDALESPPMIG